MYGLSTKSQFFIVSVVFIAITLAAITIFLRIPEDIGPEDFYLEENILTSIDIVQKSINKLLLSTYADWWDPYYQERIKITLNETKNSESNFINYIVTIDLPDDIDVPSMRLVQNGYRIPHDVYWTAEGIRVGEINFQTSITKGERKNLYLYYNREPEVAFLDKSVSDNKNIRVVESASNFTINSPNYEVIIDKNAGGVIVSLKSKNIFTNLVYNISNYKIQSMFTCNGTVYAQEDDIDPTITVVQNDTNLVILRVTGDHGIYPGRQFFSQNQFYYPDKIKIAENIRWTEDINCESGTENFLMAKFVMNASTITMYKDNDTTTTEDYDTYDRPGPWIDYYYATAGTGLIIPNESQFILIKRTSSSTNKSSELILLNNTILTAGTFDYSYEIYPHRNTWTELEKYYNLTGIHSTSSGETFETFFSNQRNALERSLSNRGYTTSITTSSEEIFQTYRNQKEWYNKTFLPNYRKVLNLFTTENVFDYPVVFTTYLEKDIDYNSLFISDDSAQILPTQIITPNQTSSFNVYCQNQDSPLYSNYTYYMFNPDGENFTTTITLDASSPFNATISYPNGTCLVCEDTFTSTKTYSVTTNSKGFYRLDISNKTDNKYFQMSTSLPYSVLYNQRIRCKASGSEKMYFHLPENTTQINVSVKALNSNANARIKDLEGNILKQNNSISLGTTYEFLVTQKKERNGNEYYLEYETSGDVEIFWGSNLHRPISTDYRYFVNYDKPLLELIFQKDIANSERYYIYYDRNEYREPLSFDTDLVVDISNNQVNNTFFSWDFDDNIFRFKGGENWFDSTDKWLTDFGNSSGVNRAGSATLTNIEIIETGPIRARIRAESGTNPNVVYYFNIWSKQNFITVETEVADSIEFDLTTGPFWRINKTGETDFYAIYDNIDEDRFSNLYTIDRSDFAGKNVNWFGKRNNITTLAYLVPSKQIFPSNQTAKITIDRMTIALPSSQKNEFYIYIDEYTNLTRWDNVRNYAQFLESPYTLTDDITTADVTSKSKFVTIIGKII